MFTATTDYNLVPCNVPDAETNATFEAFIEEQEEKRLIRILGLPLYNSLIAGLAAPIIEQRWLNISVGCQYTALGGRKYNWDGLVVTLKHYIVAEWLRVRTQEDSNNGVVESENENATTTNPAQLIVPRWNEFAEKIGGDHDEECYTYEKNTLFGMLYTNRAEYEDVATAAGYVNFLHYLHEEFNYPGKKNAFNI